MESHEAGFPPFPHSLEIPSGFPHSHGLGDGLVRVIMNRQATVAKKPTHRKNGWLLSTRNAFVCPILVCHFPNQMDALRLWDDRQNFLDLLLHASADVLRCISHRSCSVAARRFIARLNGYERGLNSAAEDSEQLSM